MKTLHDRIRGCIIGGAIGDYIGSPFEGRPGPIDVAVPVQSAITDDTQLTLATCEAIMGSGEPDPDAIARRFSEWYAQRRMTGIGSSTLKALRDLSFGAHWALAGANGEMSAGNGAAMRIAPIAFCVDPLSPDGRKRIKDASSVTHRNDEAYVGALAIAIAIAAPDFDFIPTIISALPDSNTRDRLTTLTSEAPSTISALGVRFGASGYVADSVPLALVAASRAETGTFKDAVLGVISAGGDTDTTGSMVGQIVGSKVGLSCIPEDLQSLSLDSEPVLQIAQNFASFVCKNSESGTSESRLFRAGTRKA